MVRPFVRLGAIALAVSLGLMVAQPAYAAATATFTRTGSWETGYEGRFTIGNTGPGSITSWTVEFDLPAGSTLGTFWDALVTASGNHYTARNRDWNGTVPVGGSASFGFIVNGTGNPINCRINGGSCGGGGGGPDTQPPTVPTGLSATGTSASTIALSWNASTDNVGVTGYEIQRNGSVVATVTGTSHTDGGLAANTSYTYRVRARDAAGNFSAPSAAVTGTTTGGGGGGPGPMAAAPYLYFGWGSPPSPPSVMSATGVRWFTLAFVLSNGGCAPAWDGNRPLTGGVDASQITAIRNAGGNVIPSFGGWAGNKLGLFCSDATSLANAYQQVINAYSLRAIDVDIENTEFESEAAQDRVLEALRIVKQRNPGITTIITFPTLISGPNFWGQRLIRRAAELSANLDVFTIMPFDFGGSNMLQDTISAAEGLRAQLTSRFGWSADTAYRHMGISSMNGRTDIAEIVDQAAYRGMRDWAQQRHLARFTFWSVNRDRPCTGGDPSACSGIPQQQWDFTRITAQYTG